MTRFIGFFTVLFLVAAVSASAGDAGIGLGAGYVDPSNVGGTFWLTGNARFKVAESIAVEPEAGFWKKSESMLGLVDFSVKDINVGASVLYLVPAGKNVTVSLGGGVGVHFLKGAVGVFGFTESDTETKVGGQLVAGADFKVAEKVTVFGNVRYDLVSDMNQFKVYGGIRFGL